MLCQKKDHLCWVILDQRAATGTWWGWLGSRVARSRMESDGMRFHHATQKNMKFKSDRLFISGLFHLIFLDCSWLKVTETVESKTTNKEGLLYFSFEYFYKCYCFLRSFIWSYSLCAMSSFDLYQKHYRLDSGKIFIMKWIQMFGAILIVGDLNFK